MYNKHSCEMNKNNKNTFIIYSTTYDTGLRQCVYNINVHKKKIQILYIRGEFNQECESIHKIRMNEVTEVSNSS